MEKISVLIVDDHPMVLEGLKVGDKVVVKGSFALRAEAAKTNMSSEHQH